VRYGWLAGQAPRQITETGKARAPPRHLRVSASCAAAISPGSVRMRACPSTVGPVTWPRNVQGASSTRGVWRVACGVWRVACGVWRVAHALALPRAWVGFDGADRAFHREPDGGRHRLFAAAIGAEADVLGAPAGRSARTAASCAGRGVWRASSGWRPRRGSPRGPAPAGLSARQWCQPILSPASSRFVRADTHVL
jgi:hypothetical protein